MTHPLLPAIDAEPPATAVRRLLRRPAFAPPPPIYLLAAKRSAEGGFETEIDVPGADRRQPTDALDPWLGALQRRLGRLTLDQIRIEFSEPVTADLETPEYSALDPFGEAAREFEEGLFSLVHARRRLVAGGTPAFFVGFFPDDILPSGIWIPALRGARGGPCDIDAVPAMARFAHRLDAWLSHVASLTIKVVFTWPSAHDLAARAREEGSP